MEVVSSAKALVASNVAVATVVRIFFISLFLGELGETLVECLR
jgi:hypothetical protein